MVNTLEKQKPGVKAWVINPTVLNTSIPRDTKDRLERIVAKQKASGQKDASMAKVITLLVEYYEGNINAK